MERLQKVIANSGYCSRRKAEELIQKGHVKVNGKEITELGTKISAGDAVEIDGLALKEEKKVYILLNKPRGVVSTSSDNKNRKTVVDLIDINERIYPVGRLDYDTTGVLILTNDGELTNILTHPKNEIDKIYVAKINGIPNGEQIKSLENGILIDGVRTSKSKVKVRKKDHEKRTSIIELTIHEGKNHQVKRMFEAIGYDTLKLKREKLAFLDVKSLKSGEFRYLSPKEVKKLYSLK